MKFYDKLVRDNIPAIIENSGGNYHAEIVSDDEALEYLYKKLLEEVAELLEDKNLEEIADVMEVLFAIAGKYGYSEDDVLRKRAEKKDKSGGFDGNIVLKKTW